ncbi:hypothetical protein BaRGS_00025469 [Batillaria attramentaria]|uniref:Uncharacterized protein n=1 Tax=Batillaria attramentaria TaxID=370345 RepID=A0ABD0K890_9CAEN
MNQLMVDSPKCKTSSFQKHVCTNVLLKNIPRQFETLGTNHISWLSLCWPSPCSARLTPPGKYIFGFHILTPVLFCAFIMTDDELVKVLPAGIHTDENYQVFLPACPCADLNTQ